MINTKNKTQTVKNIKPVLLNHKNWSDIPLTLEEQEFANVFLHRWNFIWGNAKLDGTQVEWTEPKLPNKKKFKLWDDLIFTNKHCPDVFIAVSFGTRTYYLVLDIDFGSSYHSLQARTKIEEALKTVGINKVNWYTSSGSGGWHGYIAFDEPVFSRNASIILTATLKQAGFKIKDGQLELYPNLQYKEPNWSGKGEIPNPDDVIAYKKCRLPCQGGFSAIIPEFLADWKSAVAVNDRKTFLSKYIAAEEYCASNRLIQRRRNSNGTPYKGSNARQKYEEALAVINQGWTSAGQTNYILQNIAFFYRCFYNPEITTLHALADKCVEVATSCPGYYQYCNHQEDIERRCLEVATQAWQKYKHFNQRQYQKYQKKNPDDRLNVQQAKEKIVQAVDQLLAQGDKVTLRAVSRLTQQSLSTLSKYRDFIHELQSDTHYSRIQGEELKETPCIGEKCVSLRLIAVSLKVYSFYLYLTYLLHLALLLNSSTSFGRELRFKAQPEENTRSAIRC